MALCAVDEISTYRQLNLPIHIAYSFMEMQNPAELGQFRITVLRNVTIEPLEIYLKSIGIESALDVDVTFGGYDTIMQDAISGLNGNLNNDTDAVLIFAKLDNLSWKIARDFYSLTEEEIAVEIDRIGNWVDDVLEAVSQKVKGIILWHGFETPVYPLGGIVDSQKTNGQLSTIRILNNLVQNAIKAYSNAYFVDMDLCLMRVGVNHFYDERYWHIGRAPYSRRALAEVASEDFKFFRAIKGKARKCLVLDCDNTLWGGVVGEDGLAGIKLSSTYPGSPYYEFQQEILNLYHRGVILCLCSKNNEIDVREVLRKHPDMLLREKHFAAMQINWQDKATNLRQIAVDLNIGLESLIFVDDSEFEINLIREMLPEVHTIHLLPGEMAQYAPMLRACGLFDNLQYTDEDRQRTAMYKAETERDKHKQTVDLDSYYRLLEMEVEIFFVDDFSLPRVAQLVQKTNQFNLTTIRYSQEQITVFANATDHDVICLKLSDKFGELGLVGVCILKYQSPEAVVDTLLVSCRALGREVEVFLTKVVMQLAKQRGAESIVGLYKPTQKNIQAREFYSGLQFVETPCDGELFRFVYTLAKFEFSVPEIYPNSKLTVLKKEKL